jgi:hypothetical protein
MFDHSISQTSLILSLATAVEANTLQVGEKVFDLICGLLYTVIRYRREELLNLIPIFFGIIENLIGCFQTANKYTKLYKPSSLNTNKELDKTKVVRILDQLSVKTGDKDLVKPFAKHAPFLISKILKGGVMEWKMGVFKILDVCDDFGRGMLLAQLDVGTREVYKRVVQEWESSHRYTGKA